jgi:L-seryl-tRNA(Ser) seleniumtransferase
VAASEGDSLAEALRSLPSVDRVAGAISSEEPASDVVAASRSAIDRARARVRNGDGAPDFDDIVRDAVRELAGWKLSLLQPVINATGVLIHTNLGRSPLGERQLDAVRRAAGGYSNLEYDLAAGRRGSRYAHARRLISSLTGAESALVVNNNAAALMLVLSALCRGREVIISRGELVEIGGEFRIPDVMSASGARLVEVGTTNRTHIGDYERAVSPDTAAILKVHPANYRVEGFTAEVEARLLGGVARGRGVLFVYDVGSGLLHAPEGASWARREPLVADALTDGADLVTFSCDKLLGGPQAGVIAGRSELIAALSTHPLLRALRVDKMTLAALEATLAAYAEDDAGSLPLWQMGLARVEDLDARAVWLAAKINDAFGQEGVKAEVVTAGAVSGGGSLPGGELPSRAVAITDSERSTAELERGLRHASTPVIARIEDDRLLLDLRTVPPGADDQLIQLLAAALGRRA